MQSIRTNKTRQNNADPVDLIAGQGPAIMYKPLFLGLWFSGLSLFSSSHSIFWIYMILVIFIIESHLKESFKVFWIFEFLKHQNF